ncbi:hypothetical protein F3Y22_tig00111745pilonHSYRG00004 [Hibiscus syriacus]|uniref:Uncharacterized protein n=1 Tax=Hibiscus syriacus TaxID=106335 RepID=A0A6A2YED8_HIBSY|nr:hypothetical protein F3Y22_tig00111745pilonHSYRG00004 [Hibiscus syriacus]
MCGGAIISDFIAPPAHSSRRLTPDFLWPDLKKSGFKKGFDDYDVDGVPADVKPFAFSASKKSSSDASHGEIKFI